MQKNIPATQNANPYSNKDHRSDDRIHATSKPMMTKPHHARMPAFGRGDDDRADAALGQQLHCRDNIGGRVDRDDRELVAGQADDHVHEVTGLDHRSDARDLVDLDRHGPLAGWGVDVEDGAIAGLAEGRGGDLGALRDRLSYDLADDL